MSVTLTVENLSYLETLAIQFEIDANDLFNQALKSYRRRLEEAKIEAEKQAFLQQHAELKVTYLNQFVAIHHSQVIDHDSNMVTLHQRIRQRYGRTAILIRRVELEADRPLVWRSPKLEWG